jgi:hypothetical protein
MYAQKLHQNFGFQENRQYLRQQLVKKAENIDHNTGRQYVSSLYNSQLNSACPRMCLSFQAEKWPQFMSLCQTKKDKRPTLSAEYSEGICHKMERRPLRQSETQRDGHTQRQTDIQCNAVWKA